MAQRNRFLSALVTPPTETAISKSRDEDARFAPPVKGSEESESVAQDAPDSAIAQGKPVEGVVARKVSAIAAPQSPSVVVNREPGALMRHIAMQTLRQVIALGMISKTEANTFYHAAYLKNGGNSSDFLEVWVEAMREANVDLDVEKLVESLAVGASGHRMALCDVAEAARVPTAYYESHPDIFRVLKALRCPVIGAAEGGKFLVLVGWNPVTVRETALVVEAIAKEAGSIPFVSTMRLSHQVWQQCCQRHFSEEHND